MLGCAFYPVKDKGYHWSFHQDIYFKGYLLTDDTDQVLTGQEACAYIAEQANTLQELETVLQGVDGSFAIARQTPEGLLLAVDRARSIPIYYIASMNAASDSGEKLRKEAGIEKDATDPMCLLEFKACDYVEFENTVYSQIKQLDAGQVAYLSGGEAVQQYYYRHLAPIVERTEEEVFSELYRVSVEAFTRIKKLIAGRPVVISLSGGYDSRYVATMLKTVGVENVKCYTYGKKGSFETVQSRKVADALGYEWKCIEYTDALMEDAVSDEGYFDYCNEHDYIIYLQNFPAVKQLAKEGWFEKDSVFITGLCGDMPTGNYVAGEDPDQVYNAEAVARLLCKRKASRSKLNAKASAAFLQNYLEKIEQTGIEITDYQSYIQALDCISTCAQHSRCFLHMNRAHEFFGFQWILPFWSKQILDFWYSVPHRYRTRQNMYERFLVERLCAPYGIGTKKYYVTYSRNRLVSRIKHLGGAVLVRLSFACGKPFRRKYDYNNFSYGEYLLYSRLKNKKHFYYQKAGFVYILNRYLCEKRMYTDQ